MSSPDLISLFVAPLNRLGLTYMVTGAVASIIYGEPRLTNDIDLVVELRGTDAPALRDAFGGGDFDVPPLDVMQAEAERPLYGHFNIIHIATALKADIYPDGDDVLHRWAFPRRQAHTIGDEIVWVAPLEYVIVRKLQYFRAGGSDKHLRDVRAMLRQQGDACDRDELSALIGRQSLETEWQMVSTAGDTAT